MCGEERGCGKVRIMDFVANNRGVKMNFKFEDDEFTLRQLLEYLRRTYGTQISGNPFTVHNVNCWAKLGKLPRAYGDNKVTLTTYKELEDLRVFTVKGLSREDMEYSTGSLDELTKIKVEKNRIARKKRTPLYYQIAGRHNTTIKTLEQSILPTNYKELGITSQQLKNVRHQSKAKKK